MDRLLQALAVALLAIAAAHAHDHSTEPSSPSFIRGDSNGDGHISVSDAFWTVRHLYHADCSGYCADGGDFDASGSVNVADVVSTLNYLYASGPAPASPFPACGKVSGGLGCWQRSYCDD